MQINLEEISEGMTVAKDVVDGSGHILVCCGTTIVAEMLEGLKASSIESIEICQPMPDSIKAAIKENIRKRFHLLDLDHPFCKKLFNECFVRSLLKNENGEQSPENRSLLDKDDDEYKRRSGKDTKTYGNIELLLTGDIHLATPPVVFNHLMEIINDPKSSAEDIAEIISSDVALSTRLLSLVNSGLYSLSSEIDTIARAVAIVGTEELCDLAIATHVVDKFNEKVSSFVDMNSFWLHSLTCGLMALHIARHKQSKNVERFFVAGLLHDVGRLILLLKKSDAMSVVLNNTRKYKTCLYTEEDAVFGFTHADVGKLILEKWNLPPVLVASAGYHHSSVMESPFPETTLIIHISNIITNALDIGSSGDGVVPPLAPGAWEALRLDPAILTSAIADMDKQIASILRVILS